jgi:tRNA dimethylallyltransferase
VVGGTGLYLRAALAELDMRPPPDPAIRARYATRLDARGAPALHAELAALEPEVASTIAPTDAQRVVRALELVDGGAPPPRGDQLWTAETRHPTVLVALTMDREALHRRIDARVDAMVAAGAIDEVARADSAGASASARQALGFEELLRGDVDAMRRRTRRYAKRQLTWLRKLPDTLAIDLTHRDAQEAARAVRSALRVAADSSSEPTKRENGPMNAQ